jgi:type II restriction enzyme
MKGMLDLNEEIKIADEFWDFIGGDNSYGDLLDCFMQAGIFLRPRINKYFNRFKI